MKRWFRPMAAIAAGAIVASVVYSLLDRAPRAQDGEVGTAIAADIAEEPPLSEGERLGEIPLEAAVALDMFWAKLHPFTLQSSAMVFVGIKTGRVEFNRFLAAKWGLSDLQVVHEIGAAQTMKDFELFMGVEEVAADSPGRRWFRVFAARGREADVLIYVFDDVTNRLLERRPMN